MANQDRPTIFSPAHITRAIGDSNFFTLMPEFLPLKRKMEAMHADAGTGCSSCKRRRIATSLSSDFLAIMNRLPDASLAKLKTYLGVNRLLVRAADKSTGKVVLREV